LCPLGRRHNIELQPLEHSAKLVLGAAWEFEGEFGHPFPVGCHPRRAPCTNIGDDCAMVEVVMSRGMQTNAAILPTVGRPAEDIITLGGYPPPTSSHPPCPSLPHGTAGSLTEMSGQIGEAHHVLHHLGNLLVPLDPWGTEVDVQIAKEEGDMPARAFVRACSIVVNMLRLFARIVC
jgi:hypothetical protein